MEIRFGSSDLAKTCNCSASIDRRWGQQFGATIREGLCLLAGTPTLELLREFAGLMLEPVAVDQHGRLAITVASNCRLLVEPSHKPLPILRGRELDCKRIEKLVIMEVHVNGC
jgi:hypothetical protein